MKKRFCYLLILFSLLFCGTGCMTPLSDKPRQEPWTLSELENNIAGDDPLEPFNRCSFAIQHFAVKYPVEWIGHLYTSIFPRPFIKCINNLSLNLEFPARFFSVLLRGEWRAAGDEFLRFLANSTLGIGGLFDVGEYWFRLPSTEADFGQTFCAWGIKPGCTLLLPFMGRLNVREDVGYIFDTALDGKTYIPYSSALMINTAVIMHRAHQLLVEGSPDPYKVYRQQLTLYRELRNELWSYRAYRRRGELLLPQKSAPVPAFPKPAHIQGQWIDLPGFGIASPERSTLRQLAFRPVMDDDWWYLPLSIFNSDFKEKLKKRGVQVVKDKEVEQLTYGFVPAPEETKEEKERIKAKKAPKRKERLMILMPGIGGFYNSVTTVAFAELMNNRNFAVVTIDCPFSHHFMVRTGGMLPGMIEQDAQTLRKVLKMILDDLKKDKLIDAPEISLGGWSFGGLYTLKIAELESKKDILHISHYLALNPPGSLKQAAEVADNYMKIAPRWSEKEMRRKMVDLAGRMMTAATVKFPEIFIPDMPVYKPSQEEAVLLSALFYRIPLRPILLCAAQSGKAPALKTPYKWNRRNKLYLEIDRIGFAEYAEKFVMPQYKGVSAEELFAKCDQRTFGPALKGNGKVKVFHNWDDPLLSESDREFLDANYGKNIIWFSRGGHLGNLYMQQVQRIIGDVAEGIQFR